MRADVAWFAEIVNTPPPTPPFSGMIRRPQSITSFECRSAPTTYHESCHFYSDTDNYTVVPGTLIAFSLLTWTAGCDVTDYNISKMRAPCRTLPGMYLQSCSACQLCRKRNDCSSVGPPLCSGPLTNFPRYGPGRRTAGRYGREGHTAHNKPRSAPRPEPEEWDSAEQAHVEERAGRDTSNINEKISIWVAPFPFPHSVGADRGEVYTEVTTPSAGDSHTPGSPSRLPTACSPEASPT
ncbi:hypothetical protein J6590_008834 [Homalodisca vitripennis]|nr:hypothetical protein J6590_008834 [Homalodisca vitripennis]